MYLQQQVAAMTLEARLRRAEEALLAKEARLNETDALACRYTAPRRPIRDGTSHATQGELEAPAA